MILYNTQELYSQSMRSRKEQRECKNWVSQIDLPTEICCLIMYIWMYICMYGCRIKYNIMGGSDGCGVIVVIVVADSLLF